MAIATVTGEFVELVGTLGSIGSEVLKARHEEEFLAHLSETLRRQVGCDVVILRLLERYIQTRVVATKDGVDLVKPDEVMETFTEEDQNFLLSLDDGAFCRDISTAPEIKPRFRRHAMRLGVSSGFMAPLLRDTEICGQVIFGWTSLPDLSRKARRHLRKLADFAALMITLFQLRKGHEIDPLTGLLNRQGLNRRWPVCAEARQGALIFADLHRFKALNDARGHLAGDDVLRLSARVLREEAGSRGVLSRFGGDEFVFVGPGLGREEAEELLTRIEDMFRRRVETLPAPRPTLAAGLARWPEDGTDLKELIRRADDRMAVKKRERIGAALGAGAGWEGRAPEDFLEGWLTKSPEGIVVTDPTLKVLYVNPAYERLSGYTLDHWLGNTPKLAASGKTPREVYEDMWATLDAEGAWTGKVINRRPGGEEWVSSLRITKIVDGDNRPVGYIGVAREARRSKGGR